MNTVRCRIVSTFLTNSTTTTDYTNIRGLQGGPNVLLQNPYVSPNRGGITST